MKSIFNPRDHLGLHDRIQQLKTTSEARWGRMTALQMVAHLSDSLRMASGELEVAPKNVPFRYSPLKQLALYVLPVPKGLPTARELIARKPSDWSIEVADLRDQLNGLVQRGAEALAPAHPAFGRMSAKQWGVLIYRHMDHHLRQFGV
jgi:hypothetical protein